MSEGNAFQTHLFVVRIWAQGIEDGRYEWRGRVQYVPTGEVHYFREWPDLLAIVRRLLPDLGEVVGGNW